jgi:ABC-type maltose transport system permease subunit
MAALRADFNPNNKATHFQRADTAAGLTMVRKVVIIFLLLQCYFISGAFTGWLKK